ncbi:MAG TPA: holo-ACP synthase [Gemmatimonadaceae bacterium]|nr:holo-ACP synthase [Gemmatimonadaceae bacterium]
MVVGLGVDIVEIGRVEHMLDAHGKRALHRLFTPNETSYCQSKRRPAQHFAARLAAKEATFKALSGSEEARAISWREIEVCVDDGGRPSLMLHGRAAKRAAELGASVFWLSMTHDAGSAHATVILEAHSFDR